MSYENVVNLNICIYTYIYTHLCIDVYNRNAVRSNTNAAEN